MTRLRPPPVSLSKEAASTWKRITADYEIEDEAGILLLTTGLEAFDRMRQCQAAIKRDGPQVLDRFGYLKAHPLLPAERGARTQMLAAFKALHLDIEPLHARPGRPAGS
ncbi:hypothetical protein [Rhodanobacter lindaniclasticus]